MLDYFNKPTRTRLTVLTILVRTFWCQHSTIIETMRSETWSKRLQSALKRSLATATKGLNWAKWHQGFKQGAPAIDELHAHVSFSVFERALQVYHGLPTFTNGLGLNLCVIVVCLNFAIPFKVSSQRRLSQCNPLLQTTYAAGFTSLPYLNLFAPCKIERKGQCKNNNWHHLN